MKKIYFLFSALFITSLSFGQTIITENFDYGGSAGDLVTQSGSVWAAHSGGAPEVGYATTSLTMASYPSSGVGGSATISGSGSQDVNRTFSAENSGSVYASALVNLSAVTTAGNYFYHFRTSGGVFYGRVYAKDDGAGKILFGIREGSSGTASIIYGTTPYDLNTTYLLVLKYDFATGTASIYVLSAVVGSEPVTPEATVADADDPTEIAAIAFRQASDVPTGTIDGLRIATSWFDLMNETATPTIVVSSSVSGLNYVLDNGPSSEGTFSVSGSNLTNNIEITAPTDFEVSETSGSGFSASVTLTQTGGTVASTTIYVRLKSDLLVASYSGDVDVTSTGATAKTVALSGEVFNPPTNALTITGVYDNATGSTPKGIELYVLKDVSDLSIFGVGSANNGNGGGSQEFTFPAVGATKGDFIYIVNSSQITDFNTFFGLSITEYESGSMGINGDDAIELFESGQVIDVFGDVDTDGSSEPWEYTDGWAYRNDDSGPDGSTFVLGNWTFSGTGNLDGATNGVSASPFPIGTYSNILSTKENQIEGFSLYPNPTKEAFVTISSDNRAPMKVSVYDILGKQIIQRTITNNRLNISNLNTGVYILRAEQNNAFTTRKLIIN